MNDVPMPIPIAVDARFAGGTIWVLVAPSPIDECCLMVCLEFPGTSALPMYVEEAEHLGQVLLASAAWIRAMGVNQDADNGTLD